MGYRICTGYIVSKIQIGQLCKYQGIYLLKRMKEKGEIPSKLYVVGHCVIVRHVMTPMKSSVSIIIMY